MAKERQRDTDAPFGPEEADAIRALLGGNKPLECPRCGGRLESTAPVTGGGGIAVYSVRCPTCKRSMFAGPGTGAR